MNRFAGIKILMVCFESQLNTEWFRIARTIREMGNRQEGNGPLWRFLDFISLHRSPLYTLLLPFIQTRVQVSADSDHERHFQMGAKERGSVVTQSGGARSKSLLLRELEQELTSLKEAINKKLQGNSRIGNRTIALVIEKVTGLLFTRCICRVRMSHNPNKSSESPSINELVSESYLDVHHASRRNTHRNSGHRTSFIEYVTEVFPRGGSTSGGSHGDGFSLGKPSNSSRSGSINSGASSFFGRSSSVRSDNPAPPLHQNRVLRGMSDRRADRHRQGKEAKAVGRSVPLFAGQRLYSAQVYHIMRFATNIQVVRRIRDRVYSSNNSTFLTEFVPTLFQPKATTSCSSLTRISGIHWRPPELFCPRGVRMAAPPAPSPRHSRVCTLCTHSQ